MILQTTVEDTVAAIALGGESTYGTQMLYPQDVTDQDSAAAIHGHATGFSANKMAFTVNLHVTPSQAIHNFFQSAPTVCECHSFVMAVFYATAQELLGSEVFDACFRGMDISGKFSRHSPLHGILDETKLGIAPSVEKGDWIYITNVPEYKARHPKGNAAGWNLICVDTHDPRRYVGFGLGGASDGRGKTIDEVKQVLLDEYNKAPTVEAKVAVAVGSTRTRSGSFGSETTKSKQKPTEVERTLGKYMDVESFGKTIGYLKKQQASPSQDTSQPFFEKDSILFRLSASKLNTLKSRYTK